MLYLWWNLFYLFITSRLFLSKIDPLANLSRTRMVSILDCEGLNFMSNTRYLFYMELLRYELMFRSKLYEATAKKGIYATLGSQKIIYRRPLKRWTKFIITIVLEGWDEKWAYHKATFMRENKIYAIGYTKIAFWKDKEVQNLESILSVSGELKTKMNLSPEVKKIFENDAELLKAESF